MRKQFISNEKLTREAVNQGNTAMYTAYMYIFTAAGPFAAELMSEADADVCSSVEYWSALGDSSEPVATSRSDAGPATASEPDFL